MNQRQLVAFHWSLSDNKSPQVSRTLLSFRADLNNAVVCMVSIRPLISKSCKPNTNHLVTVPRAPITNGIIFTFMFHSSFNSFTRSKYLSFFSLFFYFTLWSIGAAKSTILQILFILFIYFFFLSDYFIRSGHLAKIMWSICILKSQMTLCVSFSRADDR